MWASADNDALSELDPGEKRKEAERRKLAALRQKKFFAMDDQYLTMQENPYKAQVGRELETRTVNP